MERSFSVGAPGTGNTIKLYEVALPGADDVNGFDSLATLLGRIQPVEKTLLLDLDVLGIPLDNVEGMTFGPSLPDGRRSLVLVSDNNFSPGRVHAVPALRGVLGTARNRPRLASWSRKTVTLVFCDVADSTPLGEQLDPEALRGVWSRYHETAREVLERHGGTIEKFVGDAVLGVFGIPVVHEDDALRAVRAAVELRERARAAERRARAAFGVRIGVRTGVHTGEVFAGDPAQGDPFATGDAVVVAQRLEATAAAGEILVGDATIRLVRDAVTVEPVPALELKGKSEPVDAWRLLDVEPDAAGVARRLDSPLVGRAAELDALLAELERASPTAPAGSSRSSASRAWASRASPPS